MEFFPSNVFEFEFIFYWTYHYIKFYKLINFNEQFLEFDMEFCSKHM
jgi:hypothetical protein